MAKIPENELNRLKQEIAVQRLAEAMGITLRANAPNVIDFKRKNMEA